MIRLHAHMRTILALCKPQSPKSDLSTMLMHVVQDQDSLFTIKQISQAEHPKLRMQDDLGALREEFKNTFGIFPTDEQISDFFEA